MRARAMNPTPESCTVGLPLFIEWQRRIATGFSRHQPQSFGRAKFPMIKGDGRSGEIRTPDPLVPNQMRYQAALRPEQFDLYFRNLQNQALL